MLSTDSDLTSDWDLIRGYAAEARATALRTQLQACNKNLVNLEVKFETVVQEYTVVMRLGREPEGMSRAKNQGIFSQNPLGGFFDPWA